MTPSGKNPAAAAPRRHNIRSSDGKFAPAASPHHGAVNSAFKGAQISRTGGFTPHQPAQVTQTVGMSPDPPANHQAAQDISPTIPYIGGSPTGFDPATGGTF
jgi:hypothetical protein